MARTFGSNGDHHDTGALVDLHRQRIADPDQSWEEAVRTVEHKLRNYTYIQPRSRARRLQRSYGRNIIWLNLQLELLSHD